MGLGLSTGGTGDDIKPYVKYDAKAGRLFRADRNQLSDGSFASESVEITNIAQMVIDLANIRVGWINYTTQGPIRRLVVLGKEPIPLRPDEKNADGKLAFKQGFEVDLLLNKEGGGGPARVLGSGAGCVIEAMDALHDAYTAAPESKAGKLPVVKISGVTPVKSGQSTNYKPTFAIVNWIDRPAALPAPTATAPAAQGAPSTGSTIVAPPAATPLPTNTMVPQPAQMADASDFG
ncbi:MAG: hypothetical protein WC100_12090 [Sterolibacterium sp.]